ncbi:MAG: UDP-N-acetylmuramate dehydrogenase [bacterium]|nr:UDP-N-acetylmuramate dehydrogenase [bacterium]
MQKNVDLKSKTSFKIGGVADYFFAVHNSLELQLALDFAREKQIKPFIFGSLTNVLLPDKNLPLVIQLQAHNNLDNLEDELEQNQGEITVWAGEQMAALAWATVRAGWFGLADFASLPGSVGGALWNNAHYGAAFISDVLVSVTYYDLQRQQLMKKPVTELNFAYDQSWFQDQSVVITEATFRLQKAQDSAALTHQALASTTKRKTSQPYDLPSAGCFWRNPRNTDHLRQLFPQFAALENVSAGFLIEQAGLKGKKVGGAQVSEVHAAFIVNAGGATNGDVRKLARLIKQTVAEKFNINLQPEVVLV